jgi:hypothetical protein
MDMTRRSSLVFGLLAAVWVLVAAWQVEEHLRVAETARTDLRNRSEATANTLGSVLRGLQLRRGGGSGVFGDRLQPVLTILSTAALTTSLDPTRSFTWPC